MIMKIRVFPHPHNTYDSVVIDTDDFPVVTNNFHPDSLPVIFVSDLIDDLISQN